MTYNPEIHHRKSIRLKEFDYSQAGYYFVTICSHNREHLFGKVNVGKMELNEKGNLAIKILLDLPNRFNSIEIDSYIIMPNHLHTIIIINQPEYESRTVGVELALPQKESLPVKVIQDRASSVPTLGRIIQVFKSISTIEINRYRTVSGIPIWQRNYFEHVIRNEKELYEIRKYIEYNPLNWMDDEYNK
ncbi:MAG: transposase [Candidatus Kapabacteria bacterium]|nr:transposase [Candidatus Kapabacteria bacterium]